MGTKRWKKIFYVGFIGILTSSAMWACYWQGSKYFDSRKRWSLIANQLSSLNPTRIATLNDQQKKSKLYAFKYIEIEGELSSQHYQVMRPRGLRTGFLVLKKIRYLDQTTGQKQEMVVLDGWCPSDWKLKGFGQDGKKKYQGILRKKQSSDYLHTKIKQSDLQKFNMNTWIDLDRYLQLFGINPTFTNTNFYFQILKPLQPQNSVSDGGDQYPYRYSVDNFELPYLTPDKHRGYATFWFCTSLVGLSAILKVLKMK